MGCYVKAVLYINMCNLETIEIVLLYSMVLLYIKDHGDFGILAYKYHSETSLTTAWQHWLGMAKPTNVFRLTPNPSNKFL